MKYCSIIRVWSFRITDFCFVFLWQVRWSEWRRSGTTLLCISLRERTPSMPWTRSMERSSREVLTPWDPNLDHRRWDSVGTDKSLFHVICSPASRWWMVPPLRWLWPNRWTRTVMSVTPGAPEDGEDLCCRPTTPPTRWDRWVLHSTNQQYSLEEKMTSTSIQRIHGYRDRLTALQRLHTTFFMKFQGG